MKSISDKLILLRKIVNENNRDGISTGVVDQCLFIKKAIFEKLKGLN